LKFKIKYNAKIYVRRVIAYWLTFTQLNILVVFTVTAVTALVVTAALLFACSFLSAAFSFTCNKPNNYYSDVLLTEKRTDTVPWTTKVMIHMIFVIFLCWERKQEMKK